METKTLTSKEKKQGCLGVLIVFILISIIVGYCTSGNEEKAEKPKVMTRTDSIKKYFSEVDGSCLEMTDKLNEYLNDPSSYEHIETKYIDLKENKDALKELMKLQPEWFDPDGLLDANSDIFYVTTSFRAKNGFNATIKSTAIGVFDVKTGYCDYFKVLD